MPETFVCSLVTPEAQVLDEQVQYASIPAWDGQIGLAYRRAPLLVKLGDGLLRLDLPDRTQRWFFIGGGFAQMKDNKLSLLAHEALPAEQVERQQVEADYHEAEATAARTDEEVQRKQRRLDRARLLRHLLEVR